MDQSEININILKLKLLQFKSIIDLHIQLVEIMVIVKKYETYPEYIDLKNKIDFALEDSVFKTMA